MKSSMPQEEINSAIMEVALSLEHPEVRGAFLDRVFEQREVEKNEMAQLLEAASDAAAFFLEAQEERATITARILTEKQNSLDSPAPFLPSTAESLPIRVGAYHLISRLGEGGGGVVYEAEQEHPVHRRMALKIIHQEMDNPTALARFSVERQALALMDHPNIARVFDTGTTPSGRPWFAMELVEGEDLVRYCKRHRLDVQSRIRLVVLVCQAIQHAHQKGIIHRDIKPSNILVTRKDSQDVPVLIDFGIAKSATAPAHGTITSHDQFFGTPAYMSPEQVALTGIDVDTRSDIYSLGALLYEVLTGSPPLDLTGDPRQKFSQIRKALLTQEILPPSAVLSALPPDGLKVLAEERQIEPAPLISFMQGDLDRITLMALEKNRTRRYQTASALADDLLRLLDHQPISARPPSLPYVLARLIRRNRFPFVAALIMLVVLVAGFATMTALYERERLAGLEQLRLKEEATTARLEEFRLRRQADARSNISRAAFLLDQGRVEDADALLKDYPLSTIEPSLEAAAVFRSLGDWNAEHGNWPQAIQCFRLLRLANRYDSRQKILQGNDIMAISATFLTHVPEEYLAFREELIDHYAPAGGRQKAEHLLKVCLLHPIPRASLEKLRRDLQFMGDPRRTQYPAWAALSQALFFLRAEEWSSGLKASRTGLDSPECKSSCAVSLEAVRSMIYAAQGQPQLAGASLTRAQDLTLQCGGRDFERGQQIPPYWFDWRIAGLLTEEAARSLTK